VLEWGTKDEEGGYEKFQNKLLPSQQKRDVMRLQNITQLIFLAFEEEGLLSSVIPR